MTKALSTKILQHGLVQWAQAASTPVAAGFSTAPAGSMFLENGSYPSIPTAIYLKLAAAAGGWTKQNLVNLRIFNIRAYGAVGDGVTDDTAAINAAIQASVAGGLGGIVYVPPVNVAAGQCYRVTRPAGNSVLGSLIFSNVHDVTMLGDGYASMISMIGDAGGAAWYLARVRNGSTGIKFLNLHLDASGIINADHNTSHIIIYEGVSGDANFGPSDGDVIGCWFTSGNTGDCVRFLGNQGGYTSSNVRVLYNCSDAPLARAFVNSQRYAQQIQVHYNWAQGGRGGAIHFEPSGGLTDAGPINWSIIGNLIDGQDKPDAFPLTIEGVHGDTPTKQLIVNYNIVVGGSCFGIDISGADFVGNIMNVNSAQAGAIFEFSRFIERLVIDSNIAISQNATNTRRAISMENGNLFTPRENVISNNFCSMVGDATGGQGIFAEVDETTIHGNIILVDVPTAGVGSFVQCKPQSTIDMDHVTVSGNLGVGVTQALNSGCLFAANAGNSMRNSHAYGNLWDNAQASVVWSHASTETFLDYRIANANNLTSGATANITPPPTNIGATIEGNAGPGTRIDEMRLAAGPDGLVTAHSGSLVTNAVGGFNTTLFYKETGTGNTGWLGIGGHDLSMGTLAGSTATAARFLAPGSFGLAAESSTSIRFIMPRAGTIRNLRVRCTAGTGGGTNTYTIRKGGANTAVAVSFANTATGANSGASLFATVAAGDQIDIAVTKASAPTTPQTNIIATFELAD